MTVSLPPMPPAIEKLPRDDRGYPVPYFVAMVNGKPDHRVADPAKVVKCLRENRCWVCGEQFIDNILAFVIGPMCLVNRISSEPPSHPECARFSVVACPFLSKPKAVRRDAGVPASAVNPAGIMIERNPGVTLIYITNRYGIRRVENGMLFSLGDPQLWEWWTEGRPASRAEAQQAIDTGVPALRTMCDVPAAHRQLDELIGRALQYLPPYQHTPAEVAAV